MTAKGKINASNVTTNDRIIVNTNGGAYEGDTIRPSATKTGEGVVIVRVLDKLKAAGRRGYVIVTSAGQFYAEPIQTMWLAPEDNAGIKRAYAEALIEDAARPAVEVTEEPAEAPTPAELVESMDEAHEATTDRCSNEWHRSAPARRRMLCPECPAPFTLTEAEIEENAAQSERENLAEAEAAREENEAPEGIYGRGLRLPAPGSPEMARLVDSALREEPLTFDLPEVLTLHSQAGKVESISKNEPEGDDMTGTDTQTQNVTRERTGSAVVRLLERVHERIRQNHPEVPEVVIVTGAGIGVFGGKWGHFRPQGWTAKDEAEKAQHIHEMFMAGETLAKGSRQVLQTMLHESAHALAEHRGEQDTSRQGRWHNKVFLKTAGELGLEYRKDKANPQIGYSEVVLKDETVEEYRDLLDALDAEIHLMVKLPGWLGGTTSGDGDDEDQGGENMGKAPKTGDPKPNTNNIKCVCDCEEPNIIRMSRKVLAQGVVRCDECEALFHEAA